MPFGWLFVSPTQHISILYPVYIVYLPISPVPVPVPVCVFLSWCMLFHFSAISAFIYCIVAFEFCMLRVSSSFTSCCLSSSFTFLCTIYLISYNWATLLLYFYNYYETPLGTETGTWNTLCPIWHWEFDYSQNSGHTGDTHVPH